MEKFDRKEKTEGFNSSTIWYKSSRLAFTQQCTNLGQGFPDWNPPEFLVESFSNHLNNPLINHQYTRTNGNLKLVQAISDTYSKIFNRNINPLTEILVTNGAVSGLYNSITSLIEKDDEVILIEPFYDCYLPQILYSGGKVIGIPMIAPEVRKFKEIDINEETLKSLKDEWKIDFVKLKNTVSNKTRLLILNSPNNPTGKVLNHEELLQISEIVKDYPNLIVISDEVYEYMIYENFDTLPRLANIPGMWEKTISIMSAGKFFSITGGRIGWLIGPENLIKKATTIFQYNSFCLYDPIQLAFADALIKANEPYKGYDNYYKWLRAIYTEQRNYFFKSFSEIKNHLDIDFYFPEGGYFVIAVIPENQQKSKIKLEGDSNDLDYTNDFNYIINLAIDKKVNLIPCSVFYTQENKRYGERFVRFAFCKSKNTIQKAADNLANIK